MSPRFSSPAPVGPRGAPGAELRRRPAVSAGLRPRVHSLPRHGRVLSAVVRRDSPGPDGVPDQEAAGGGGNALREGTHLPAGEVRGQDPQETLLGKTDGRYENIRKQPNGQKNVCFFGLIYLFYVTQGLWTG